MSIEFWKIFVPLLGAVVAWIVNEWRKRVWEEYLRKEQRYRGLVRCLEGFYVRTDKDTATRLKAEFLAQLNECWLYCPDEVIRKAYGFLGSVSTDRICSDKDKEIALGELIVTIRKDLESSRFGRRTKLTAADFLNLGPNPAQPG